MIASIILAALICKGSAAQKPQVELVQNIPLYVIHGMWSELRDAHDRLGDFGILRTKDGKPINFFLQTIYFSRSSTFYANVLTGARLLHEYGADVNAGGTGEVLWQAVEYDRHQKLTERLIEYGADIDGGSDYIPLVGAVEFNNGWALRKLLALGADPNRLEIRSGHRPLYAAALKRNVAFMKALVAEGADVNARNADGSTPLHGAVTLMPEMKTPERVDTRPVEWLLSHGADRRLKDRSGRTALDIAKRNGLNSALRLLKKP